MINISQTSLQNFSLEHLIEKAQEETTQTLWGVYSKTFKPVLVDCKKGDGKILVAFQTLAQRPAYWLVQLDSNFDFESEESIDKIVSMCESDFGSIDDYDGEEQEKMYDGESFYPIVDYSCGMSYEVIYNDNTKEIDLYYFE